MVLISVVSFAQSTSLGLRTGVNILKNKSEGCRSGVSAWSNEVYFRYRAKSRIALEVGLDYSKMPQRTFLIENSCSAFGDYSTTKIQEKSYYTSVNLGVQFDVTCPSLQSSPVFKHLRSYIGVVVSPTLVANNTEETRQMYSDGSTKIVNEKGNGFTIWTGLSHTMIYNFCCRYYISSEAQIRMDPTSFFSPIPIKESLNTGASFQIGIGYKL